MMTRTEFDAGMSLLVGTYNMGAGRSAAFWAVLHDQDPRAWLEVARFHANSAGTGQECPTPAELRDETARQAANRSFADANCPHCDDGQVLVYRVDGGPGPLFFERTVDPETVAQAVPFDCRAIVRLTTVACTCARGRSLRESARQANRPALRSYADTVGAGPFANKVDLLTLSFAIEQAIGFRRAQAAAERWAE